MQRPRCRASQAYMMVPGLLLVLLVRAGAVAVESADEPPSRPPWQRPLMLKPVFLNTTTRHVKAPAGRPAFLHCVVQHPGDKSVSWVRRRDLNILTVDRFTFTTDERFQALHVPGTQEWTLKVLSPRQEDSGVYSCQVSTEPMISLDFQLEVTVSRARILGSPELYVKTGSDVNLTCEVSHNTSAFYWYHNGEVIDFHGQRRLRLETQSNLSRLYITGMTTADTGNYTCGPASAKPAYVTVHAINGGHLAAMQHNAAVPYRPARWQLLQLLSLLLPLLLPLD